MRAGLEVVMRAVDEDGERSQRIAYTLWAIALDMDTFVFLAFADIGSINFFLILASFKP